MERETDIKPIPNFDGYFASSDGKIFSNKSGKMKEMKSFSTPTSKYLIIRLLKGEKRPHCLVHRLVAMTFIPNPNNLPEVNHKDKNILNNKVQNLEWCTRKQNLEDSYSTMSPTRNYRIARLYKSDKLLGEFKGITKAARYASKNYGVSFSSLSKYLKSGEFQIDCDSIKKTTKV